jgi:hypothetical protein
MGKEPRVRLRKFPLPATQDPYSFHIKMAALRNKFKDLGVNTASLSSPRPSSTRRATRNSLGDRWFPTEETLLRAPRKPYGQGGWSCKLVKNKPRIRLSFSSVSRPRIPSLTLVRPKGGKRWAPLRKDSTSSTDMGYRSVSPDYSPKTPPPIEDDFFRSELKDMADVRMKSMGEWPKFEAREEKYRPPEYIEGEPVQGPQLLVDLEEEDPLEDGELEPTPPASPVSESEYAELPEGPAMKIKIETVTGGGLEMPLPPVPAKQEAPAPPLPPPDYPDRVAKAIQANKFEKDGIIPVWPLPIGESDPYQARALALQTKLFGPEPMSKEELKETSDLMSYNYARKIRKVLGDEIRSMEEIISQDPPSEVQIGVDQNTCILCYTSHFPKCDVAPRYGPMKLWRGMKAWPNKKACFVGTGMMANLPKDLEEEVLNLSLEGAENGGVSYDDMKAEFLSKGEMKSVTMFPLYRALIKRVNIVQDLDTRKLTPMFVEFYIPSVITEIIITERMVAFFATLKKAKESYNKGPIVAVLPPPRPQLGWSFSITKNRHLNLTRTFLAVADAMGMPAVPLLCVSIYSVEKGGYVEPEGAKTQALYSPLGLPSQEMYSRMAKSLRKYM